TPRAHTWRSEARPSSAEKARIAVAIGPLRAPACRPSTEKWRSATVMATASPTSSYRRRLTHPRRSATMEKPTGGGGGGGAGPAGGGGEEGVEGPPVHGNHLQGSRRRHRGRGRAGGANQTAGGAHPASGGGLRCGRVRRALRSPPRKVPRAGAGLGY